MKPCYKKKRAGQIFVLSLKNTQNLSLWLTTEEWTG